ncbi:MAG: CDP-alcohol phosphatidyltransferase family protein [Candidatus Omnitrophota bacterium]
MTIANKISVFRILIIPFFIATILYYDVNHEYLRYIALGLFILAMVSDGLDGYIARKKQVITKAGAIIDPLADKLLIIAAFIYLYIRANVFGIELPLWIVVIVISRDFIILLGSFVIYIVKGNLEIKPTILGKITTNIQMFTIVVILLKLNFISFMWILTVITTVISGFNYIQRGFKVLYANDD